MEFELGAHCHYELCRQHTYLPVKCISCKHRFCKSHIDFASHQCLNSSKQNKTDVKGAPGFSINAGESCSYSKCTKVTLVTVLCKQCNKLFCVPHRHVDTHKCGKDLGIKNIDGCRVKKKKKKKKKKTKTTDIENVQCQNDRKEEENSLSDNKWKCLECSTMNESDRNVIPCAKCQILNSETNLYRSRCLYLLGNIAKPMPRLLPLKIPFFIYPLAPPMVTITKQVINEGVWIHFEIDYLNDSKGIEMYHIEKVKFEMWKLDNIDIKGTITWTKYLDFVIKNLTPYYNVFTKFFKKPYFGKFRVEIKAKCYGSNLVSPTKILKFDLLPPKTSTTSPNRKKRQFNEIVDNKKQDLLINNYKKQRINDTKKHSNQNRKQPKAPKIDDDDDHKSFDDELKLALALSMMEPSDDDNDNNNNKNKNNKNNVSNLFYKPANPQSLSKKIQIQKQNQAKKRKTAENDKIKAEIARYRKMMVKGCGEPRCTNPYCKSNKYKTYSAQQVTNGGIALKMMKFEIKDCTQFKKRKLIKDKKKRIARQKKASPKTIENKSNDLTISKVLVVLIFVEEYFGDKHYKSKAHDLPGVATGKRKMIDLFSKKYNYDVICNKRKHCTLDNVQKLGEQAKISFAEGDYESIIIVFSGHGSIDTLILSDYQQIRRRNMDLVYRYHTINRLDLETYFNGISVPNKAKAIKLYFVDACRGGSAVKLNTIATTNNYNTKDSDQPNISIHPNANRCIFYPNTQPYSTYDARGRGGILINSLYESMLDNILKNKDNNFLNLQDSIIEKAENSICTVIDANGKPKQVKLRVEFTSTIKNKDSMKIKFKKNPIAKNKRKGYFGRHTKINQRDILFQ